MVTAKQRRLQRRKERRERAARGAPVKERGKRTGIDKLFHDQYKPLFFITIALLLFSILTIGYTYVQTGDVFYKGVSLSGGLTVTVPSEGATMDLAMLEESLFAAFPEADFAVREISDLGTQVAVIIEAAPQQTDAESLRVFEAELLDHLEEDRPDIRDTVSVEVVGSALGLSFFKQTAKAVLIAFALMGMVVFLYFGDTKLQKALVVLMTLVEAMLIWYAGGIVTIILALILGIALIATYVRLSIPSAAVILAAVSTILFTVAVVDIMQLRISTAGIAAFLMLIGYSVDTDILLSTRVLKRSEGKVYDRVVNALKTGLTMEVTTMVAALVALIFTQSDVIKEIMLIIFIGLFADVFFTWIQNAGLLRLFLEKRGAK